MASAPSGQPPSTDPNRRLDGLREWVAQVDRKLGIRTYAGVAITVLALATAVVALVLAIQAREDAATQRELDAIEAEIATIERQAGRAAEREVASLSDRVTELEREVSRLSRDQRETNQQIAVIEDDIDDLRSELSNGGN